MFHVSCFIFQEGFCQDIHFSQINQTPLLLNPALAGAFGGNQRAFLNYKQQGIPGTVLYETYSVSYDMALYKKRWDRGHLGAGIFAFSDKAGAFEMGINQVNISFSAIVPLNQHHNLSAGLQGGFAQRTLNTSNLKWTDQFKEGEFDPGIASGETSNFNTSAHSDFSAGLSWGYVKDETDYYLLNINAGIAIFHLNKPEQEFYTGFSQSLYPRIVLHANTYITPKGLNIALLPSFIYVNQGPAGEINFGTMLRLALKEESKHNALNKTAVLLGVNYKTGGSAWFGSAHQPSLTSIIPSFIIEITNFALGISYDFIITGSDDIYKRTGGIEISLRYLNPSPFRNIRKPREGMF